MNVLPLQFIKTKVWRGAALAIGEGPFPHFSGRAEMTPPNCFLMIRFLKTYRKTKYLSQRHIPVPALSPAVCEPPIIPSKNAWQWKPFFPLYTPHLVISFQETPEVPLALFMSISPNPDFSLLASLLLPWFPGWALPSFLIHVLLPRAQTPAAGG